MSYRDGKILQVTEHVNRSLLANIHQKSIRMEKHTFIPSSVSKKYFSRYAHARICVLRLQKEAKIKLLKARWLEPTLLFPRSHQTIPVHYRRFQLQEFSQRVKSFEHQIGHSYSQ